MSVTFLVGAVGACKKLLGGGRRTKKSWGRKIGMRSASESHLMGISDSKKKGRKIDAGKGSTGVGVVGSLWNKIVLSSCGCTGPIVRNCPDGGESIT